MSSQADSASNFLNGISKQETLDIITLGRGAGDVLLSLKGKFERVKFKSNTQFWVSMRDMDFAGFDVRLDGEKYEKSKLYVEQLGGDDGMPDDGPVSATQCPHCNGLTPINGKGVLQGVVLLRCTCCHSFSAHNVGNNK